MTKEETIKSIIHWLHRFGKRDNETFYLENVNGADISVQYMYDENGDEYTPRTSYHNGSKLAAGKLFSDITLYELENLRSTLYIQKS